MKKIILLAFICIGAATGANAQRAKIADDPLDKQVLAVNMTGAEMATVEMKQTLQLTTEQEAAVSKLNEERYKQILDAENAYAANPTLLQRKFRNIHLQSDKALNNVLTDEQLNLYLELEGRQNTRFISENGDH
ncbi:hypothetical protein [Pontibacter vulgaris]|uniref:hypothetical protein n=1 Tax=Pontibacter vulgaris TaxID=2905679 RepID=UPI001FA78780|nr:hypothetical protein [Pontibacter vulgaris]